MKNIAFLPEDPWERLRKHSILVSEEKTNQKGGSKQKQSQILATRPWYRSAFLLPYFNLRSLIDDESVLLCLLQSRTASSPDAWAPLDFADILWPAERSAGIEIQRIML